MGLSRVAHERASHREEVPPLPGPAHPDRAAALRPVLWGEACPSVSYRPLELSPSLGPCYFHLVRGEEASKLFPQTSSATSHPTHAAARVTF